MVDVFPFMVFAPGEGSRSVTIDTFGTNPDGTLLDSSNPPGFFYDTTLGIRVKSTGEWVATNDDIGNADGQYGGSMLESQVTFDATYNIEYEVVVGAYSDDVPLNYGVTSTTRMFGIDGEVIEEWVYPLNDNASIALDLGSRARTDPDGLLDSGSGSTSTGTGSDEVNGAASITTNGGSVSLTLEEADALLNGNGVAPAQTGSVAADVTVTGTISVSDASSVLGTTYDVVDDAATVAAAITAGNAEVNGAASITTNGGAVDLSFADADSLLNGNGVAPAQTGSVAADVTVTGTISVSEASMCSARPTRLKRHGSSCLSDGATALGVAGAQEIIVEGIINQAQYEILLDTGSMVTAPGLDPSADMDGSPLSVDVDRFDILTGLAESGDVTVTLDGLDDDIVAVSVTVGDQDGSSVAAVVNATEGGFVVDDIDVSGLSDGDLNVSVTVTDLAGNTSTTGTSFVLDTTADADADPLTLSIPQGDGIVGI